MSPLPINHPLLQAVRRCGDLIFSPLGAALAILLGIVLCGCAYTVDQAEQVVVTQFGRPVGTPINSNQGGGAGPGLRSAPPGPASARLAWGYQAWPLDILMIRPSRRPARGTSPPPPAAAPSGSPPTGCAR